GEVSAGLRVEVNAQLVRVLDVIAPHRPGVKRDGADLSGPRRDGRLGRADLIRRSARGERDLRRLDVRWRALGDALLIERVTLPVHPGRELDAGQDALWPSLERGRPVVERAQDAVADARVVP